MSSLLRRLPLFLLVAAFACGLGAVRASAAVVASAGPTFTAATTSRTWMDQGNVWGNSAIAANGDQFSITLQNNGGTTASGIVLTVALPAGFTRIGTSSPSVTGTTTTLTFATQSIPANGTVTYTFGLSAGASVVAGTYAINYSWTGGGTASLNVLVKAGAYVTESTPAKLTLQVNAAGIYTYKITNTGLGGLFNVVLDEAGNTAPSNAWTFNSFGTLVVTPGSISSGTPVAAGTTVTIPYLAPGAVLTIPVNGTVNNCVSIQNNYKITHLLDSIGVSAFTPIELDLTKPLLAYTLPTIPLSYGTPVPVSIPLNNTGNGDATGVTVATNFPTLSVTITPGTGWTYNSTSGVFTLTAGTIANAASTPLVFTVQAANACNAPVGGTYIATATYTDHCGNSYALPTALGTLTPPANAPTLTLTKTASAARIPVGGSGSFTVTASATNVSLISTTGLVVTDVVPAGLTLGTVTPSTGTVDPIVGNTIVWRVPVSSLGTARTLTVNFTTSTDPCDGGGQYTNTASTNTLVTTAGCNLSETASATIYVSNLGGGATITSTFELNGTPAVGGKFETGVADNIAGGTAGTRDLGEGEFIPVISTYVIGAGYVGSWAGSTYYDDFGGLAGARLVPGTVEVSVDGGAWTDATPAITSTATDSHLTINLGFLAGAGYFNDPSVGGVADRSLRFRYQLTAADSDLGGGIWKFTTQRATLTVNGGSAGACTGGIFTQWVLYSIARAEAGVSLSMPVSVELCQDFPVTITVSPNPNGNSAEAARNLLVTLLTNVGGSKYDYVGAPVYGGVFTAGNIAVGTVAGQGTTFTYTGNLTQAGGNGTITVTLHRHQAAAPAALDTATSPALGVSLAYDDNQTAPAAARVFSASASAAPVVVLAANLQLFATPQKVNVIDQAVSWTAYVTNAGNGTAYSTQFQITYPSGITPDSAATLAAAITGATVTAGDVNIAGSLVTVTLGDIASGVQVKIPLSGTLTGTDCSFTSNPNAMLAQWGCNSQWIQTQVQANPVFNQPSASLQILHDTRSKAVLCAQSEIIIIARNVGLPTLTNLKISELLGTSGLSYVAGSTKFATNTSGADINDTSTWTAASDPTTAGTTLTWDYTQVSGLTTVVGSTNAAPAGRPNTVYIRFLVQSSEATNAFAGSITANLVDGKLPCGSSLTPSPGTAYTLPIQKPIMTLVKTGINRTAAGGAFSTGTYAKTIYGGVGDVVEWKIALTNTGTYAAQNVRLQDVLAGTSPSAVSLKDSTGTNVAATYTSGNWVTLPDIPAATTVTYYFVETLGTTCVSTGTDTATVNWGCIDNGSTAASNLVTPSDNSDTATLVMRGTYSTGTGAITLTNTALNGGRLKQVITLTNGGGTVKDLVATLTLTNGLVLDTSTLPAISGTNTTSYTGVTLDNTTPSAPTLTFTPGATANAMRFGQTVSVTVYYLAGLTADTTANTASPTMAQVAAYQMPETVANGLDPLQPTTAAITVGIAFNSTCGDAGTDSKASGSLTTAVPDLDITVSPSPVQLLAAQAPYTYVFDYTIINNGPSGSVADHIQFRIPTVGGDWASVSAKLLTPGTGGSTVTTTNSGANYLIDASNIGTLSAGQTAVVRVTAVTVGVGGNGAGTPKAANLVLVGEVQGSLYNQAAAYTGSNYSLDRAAPTISDNFNISGYLYLDSNHNGTRESTGLVELGSSIPGVTALYAKIIDTAAPTVAIAAVPLASDGSYSFVNAIGPGTYAIIIDNNNTLSDVTPTVLAGYVGTEMPGLTREVVVGVTSVFNQNFGVFSGSKLTGTVFNDTGTGGGTANNGIKDGTELGIPGVTVKATNTAGTTTYDTAVTGGDGTYTLWVSVSAAVKIVETNLANYTSTGGSVGTTAGTYTIGTDTTAFTSVAGTTYTGVNFGDVPPSVFLTDGQQTILPGATATYTHTFIAGTGGKVSFAISGVTSSPSNLNTWSQVLYLDANGDGEVNPGETVLDPSVALQEQAVAAGTTVKIVLKQFAPVNAPLGVSNTVTITATFTALNGVTTVFTTPLTHKDITITGVNGSAALDLVKTVNVDTALPGAPIIYTITYTNKGTDPLKNVEIYDQVPAYTQFVSATAVTPPENGLTIDLTLPPVAPSVSGITRPAVNATTGAIIWKFAGTLIPGGTGTVSFTVQVVP